MTFQIQLTTRDEQHLRFDCAPGQDLLTAAAAANIMLPSQCRKGSCGACHASVTDGDYQMDECNPDVLSPDQSSAILMCRTTPCSDLHVTVPYDHTKVLRHVVPRRLTTITSLETIAQNTVRLELALAPDATGSCAAEFEPGQFMELEIPCSDERRPYSLANTSNWEGRLEFLIRLQPNGRFSTIDELEELKARLPQLEVDLCVWKPVSGWNGFRGTPVDALRVAFASTNCQQVSASTWPDRGGTYGIAT